jgi:hypothetical protein
MRETDAERFRQAVPPIAEKLSTLSTKRLGCGWQVNGSDSLKNAEQRRSLF